LPQITFDAVLDAIESLPADEQAELLEVARRRLAERGRSRVIKDVGEGEAHFRDGTIAPASVDEIMREIES
jgi:hypothetical protein